MFLKAALQDLNPSYFTHLLVRTHCVRIRTFKTLYRGSNTTLQVLQRNPKHSYSASLHLSQLFPSTYRAQSRFPTTATIYKYPKLTFQLKGNFGPQCPSGSKVAFHLISPCFRYWDQVSNQSEDAWTAVVETGQQQ